MRRAGDAGDAALPAAGDRRAAVRERLLAPRCGPRGGRRGPHMNAPLGWGRGLALLGALSVAVYLSLALCVPGTFTYAPSAVRDDARQFGTWWPQTLDPRLLVGDPMAQ